MGEEKNMNLDRGNRMAHARFLRIGTPARILSASLATCMSLASLGGCARQKDGDASPRDAGAASTAPAPLTSASPAPSSTGSAAPPSFGLAFSARLGREAAARPTDTPKAEDVLAAVAKSGVPLEDEAQHLGSPVGASYCIGAKSPQNVAMSACEYADPAAAIAGRELSLKTFATLQHRDVVVNKKTTLTILQSPFDAKSQAAHDKAIAAFKSM